MLPSFERCSGDSVQTLKKRPASKLATAPNATRTPIGTRTAPKPLPIPAPPQVQARGYILLDFTSGQVLAATNQDERLEPASLTKLMSAYGVFHAIKDGRIKLTDMVRISPHARNQDGSRMFVEVGSLVSVENLIQGMIVQSGNDATVALAAISLSWFGMGFSAFGFLPAVLALALYSMLPVLRNTITGLQGVDAAILDARSDRGDRQLHPGNALKLSPACDAWGSGR